MSATRRFLQLLWIEIKRCRARWIAVPLAGFLVFSTRRALNEGVVLWSQISTQVAMSHLFIGIIGTGVGAWVNGRIARNRVATSIEISLAPASRAHIVASLAVVVWMVLVYFVVFVWLAAIGIRSATWGGPEMMLIGIGAVSIIPHVFIGGLVGIIWKSPLAAPVSSIAIFAIPLYLFGSYDDAWGIVWPWRFMEVQERPEFFTLSRSGMGIFLVWCLILAATSALLVALFKSRTIAAAIGLAGILVTSVGFDNEVIARSYERELPGNRRPYEPVCEFVETVEICFHPAYETLMRGFSSEFRQLFGPLLGIVSLPERLLQTPFGMDESETTMTFMIERQSSIGVSVQFILREWIMGAPQADTRGLGNPAQ